jgi:competence protein ComEA
MSERRQRGALWSGALLLTLALFIPKGHETPHVGEPSVALLCGKPGTATIRLAGDLPHPGLYRTTPPGTAGKLIRQAVPGWELTSTEEILLSRPLADGDLVTIIRHAGEDGIFVWGRIPARQRIALGIPLEPAVMTRADWEDLPGIGPALSRRITSYGKGRGVRALDDLREVKGIGEQTIERLRPLFYPETKEKIYFHDL